MCINLFSKTGSQKLWSFVIITSFSELSCNHLCNAGKNNHKPRDSSQKLSPECRPKVTRTWQYIPLPFIIFSPACHSLGVSQLDSVIIAPPPLPDGDNQTLEHLQPLWAELEGLVRSNKVTAIGTSDLDKTILEQLYNWAQVHLYGIRIVSQMYLWFTNRCHAIHKCKRCYIYLQTDERACKCMFVNL